MYITLDIDECTYDNSLVDLIINKHTKKYVKTLITLMAIPKYQAIAMQNALKNANPEDYKTNNVLHLVLNKEIEYST